MFVDSRETSFRSQELTCPDFGDGEFPSFDSTVPSESGSSEPSTREASVSPRIVTHEMTASDWGALQTRVQIETSSTSADLGMVVNMIPVQVTGVLQVPVLPMQPSSKQSAQHSRHANEMDEVARAWLLRAELAKSAVENLRVHMDLRANQAKNRNSLVRKINIAPAQG